jgi:hypothetical protein
MEELAMMGLLLLTAHVLMDIQVCLTDIQWHGKEMKYGKTTCHFGQKLIWFMKAFLMAQVKHVRRTLMNVIPTLASTTQPAWMTSMATPAYASLVIQVRQENMLACHLFISSRTTGKWPST